MKANGKREGSLKIPIPFDEAMALAVMVKPPREGWAAYEKQAKKKRPAKAKKHKRAA
jgi:hypothetical protein